MIRFLAFVFIFLFALVPASHSAPEKNQSGETRKKSKKVRSEAGLNIPSWGIAVDAVYDSRLDSLIPGYKILNVVLTNRSPGVIYLDPAKDQWEVRDSLGKTHGAINHLRQSNEKTWSRLPQGLKEKLEYPHMVRIGNSTKIDLFFPDGVELLNFREISWKSSHFKKEFDLYTSSEKTLEMDAPLDPQLKSRPTYRQSMEKYDGTPGAETKPLPGEEPPAFDPNLDDWSIKKD